MEKMRRNSSLELIQQSDSIPTGTQNQGTDAPQRPELKDQLEGTEPTESKVLSLNK